MTVVKLSSSRIRWRRITWRISGSTIYSVLYRTVCLFQLNIGRCEEPPIRQTVPNCISVRVRVIGTRPHRHVRRPKILLCSSTTVKTSTWLSASCRRQSASLKLHRSLQGSCGDAKRSSRDCTVGKFHFQGKKKPSKMGTYKTAETLKFLVPIQPHPSMVILQSRSLYSPVPFT